MGWYLLAVAGLCLVAYKAARSPAWATHTSRAIMFCSLAWSVAVAFVFVKKGLFPEYVGTYILVCLIIPAMFAVFINRLGWLFRPITPRR